MKWRLRVTASADVEGRAARTRRSVTPLWGEGREGRKGVGGRKGKVGVKEREGGG